MSQYKVPQDVEADDKLLGPFTFRQLIYLFIAAGFGTLAYFLATLSLPLLLIPTPFVIFFTTLALPLKKDQPMETYLAALVSFYLKPRKRFWIPGESESTIKITAPKIVEDNRARNLSSSEASNRLSFLANVVDSKGQAIRDSSPIREELFAEADNAIDMFEVPTPSIDRIFENNTASAHAAIVNQMKASLEETSRAKKLATQPIVQPASKSSMVVKPIKPTANTTSIAQPTQPKTQKPTEKPTSTPEKPLVDLANNPSLSVQTIAKQANRIQQSRIDETNETFISLH